MKIYKLFLISILSLILFSCANTVTHETSNETTLSNVTTNIDMDTRLLIASIVESISQNTDFQNTWFEAEKEYYSQFFTSYNSYHIEYEDVIDYNVQNIIFHEGSIRINRINLILEELSLQEYLFPNQSYEINNSIVAYYLEGSRLNLSIENNLENRYGWYRIELRDNGLWFDALELSNDSPFEGEVINYILYDENVSYHERTVLKNADNHHYFQYDYDFDENLVTTFTTTSLPDLGYYDIGRAERHFNENYYFVYSMGTNYSQKFFTLLNENHGSINVNAMTINIAGETNSFTEVQWNLLDITGWSHIENNKVYFAGNSTPITPFNYRELPYFGPEFTIYKIFEGEFSSNEITNPLGIFEYSIFNTTDFLIPQQSLDNISEEFSATQDTYTAFGLTYDFSSGFNDRLYEFIDESYLNNFLTQH